MKARRVIVALVVALLCGVGYVAFSVHHYVAETVPNSYAVEWVGGIVVDYLRKNDGRWPQSWEDLRPVYEQHVSQVGRSWTFDELMSRVRVRWDVDIEQVRRLPKPPDGLIFLRNGGHENWGLEPNEMVHRYLTNPSAR